MDEPLLQEELAEISLVFRDAPATAAEGETIINRVVADMDMWKADGVDITELSTRLDGTVVIRIKGKRTAVIQASFVDAYGPLLEVVEPRRSRPAR